MKLLVNREALAEALSFATDIVKVRTPKPVLTAVKLAAVGKSLTVVGTDMEVGMRWGVKEVDVADPGEAVIPAAKLASIVGSISDDVITIEGKGEEAIIKSCDANFKVYGYAAGEFPPVAEFTPADSDLMMEGAALVRMIEQTEYAIAKEIGRYATTALYFERVGGKLMLVSTDGHRLAIVGTPMKGDAFGHCVPKRAVSLVRTLLDNPKSMCRVQFTPHSAAFAVTQEDGTSVVLNTMLQEGTFPPYADVTPKDCDKKAVVNRERLMNAIRQAAHLTNEESKGVRLAFTATRLQISGRAPSVGEATVDMPVEFVGEELEIGFNPVYLLDALKAQRTDTVTMEMRAGHKPLKLTAPDTDGMAVVMPVNLS